MKNKPKPTSRPKKQLKKTPLVKAALSGKKKNPAEKTDRNKIGTPDNANLHKIEKELRETKERLRLLSEAAEEGIAVHDKGVILDANDAFARMFGYELSEIIGMKAEGFTTPESWKVIRKHIATGYNKPYEGVGVKKDGSTFVCSLVGKPYKYKGRTLRLSTFHDITERKSMEEKLRSDEQLFRALAEQSSDIIIFVNREGIVTYENPAVEKHLGFKPEERIGVNLFERIHPDDLKFARDTFNAFKVNNSSKDINSPVRQIRIRHQNGNWRTFETVASRILHNNIVETVIINLRDITERKNAESQKEAALEALRESENRLRAQYNGNPIPTFTWQKQGDEFILTDINDSAKIITGNQWKPFLGRQASEMYKSRQDILRTFQICFDEKVIIGIESKSEHFMPGKSVVITFVFIPPDLVMVHMEDITERKQMEEALRKSELMFRRLFENSPVGVFLLNNRIFTKVNPALCDISGYSPEELIGQSVRIGYKDDEEYERAGRIIYEQVIKDGTSVIEARMRRKNGDEFDGLLYLSPIDPQDSSLGYQAIMIDITERKKAEAQKEAALDAVRERDLRFRKLSSHVPGMIYQFMKKPDGSYCVPFTSEAINDIFGCSPQDVHDDFSPISKVILPEDLDKVIFSIEYSAEHLTTFNIEYRVQIPGQSIKWLGGHSTPEKLADGSIIWHGFNTDITERKKAEKDLQDSEELFRNLFQYHAAVKLIIDPETGKIMDANEAAVNYYGWPREQITHMKIQDINTLSQEEVKIAMEKAKTRKRISFEFRHRRADGSVRDVDVFSSNIKAQGKDILHTIVHDITERKKVEEALRESEKKYRLLTEKTSDIVWIQDMDLRTIYVTPSIETVLGFTPEERINQTVEEQLTPDSLSFVLEAMAGELALETQMNTEPQRYVSFVLEFYHKDGSTRWLEAVLSGLRNEQGVLTGIHGVGRDITERKKTEDELNKYRDHLEELVHERTIKLEASNMELEAFSYSASHDLRAPLRTIEGFSQALLEDCGDKLDIQGKDYLRRIRTATSRMTELIEDLLQLSRITRTELNIEKINLTRIARSVIDELQKSQPQRNVEIRIADGMEDIADSKLMRIVLENLLGNAWKFTGNKAQAVIEFGFKNEGGKKVYFIRDNGAGFDMAYADKLFAPFQRLHTEDEFPGTGIGLATVRRIIHRHGGHVRTKGAIDKGATFYFSLNEK